MTTTLPNNRITADSFSPATGQASRGLTLLLYGAPGAGKTTLAAGGPAPLVIDLDGGAFSLADRADVQIFRPANWDALGGLYTYLRGTHPFKTVIFDSITEAYRMALNLAQSEDPKAQPGAGPQLQHHGAATERLVRLVRAYTDLAATGLHVVLTAPESLKVQMLEGDEKGRLERRPALPPRAWEGVQAAVDSVVRLVPTATGRRLVLRSNNPFLAAKFRAPSDVTVPDRLDNPVFADLLRLLRKDH